MTRRLMWWLTGSILLFWLAATGLGAYVMQDEFDEAFDGALEQTARRLMPLIVEDQFQRDSLEHPWRVNDSGAENEEYLTYQLRDASGALLLHSHDAPAEPFDVPLARGFADTPQNRIYTEVAVSGTLFLQVADAFAYRREATVEGVTSLLLPIIPLVPLCTIAVWLIVRRSLAPLGSLREEIGARDGANLQPMAIAGLPVELETIGNSVNRLLERLRVALEAEREFASNSAHELRTPIAAALAQTQRLIAELPPGAGRSRAQGIETSLSALSHLAEKLLQLARADSGIGLSVKQTDIVPIVALVVEDFSRIQGNTDRLVLDLDDLGDDKTLRRKVDVDALGIILRNLIENALIHGTSARPIVTTVTRDGSIRVVNSGASIPATQLDELKTRFKRGASPAAGSGLGLSIADMLARQMHGSLSVSSPAAGSNDGFEAILLLAARQ